MHIQVLGSGCPTCHTLFEITKKVVDEMGLNDQVEYVTGDDGIKKIISLGAVSSPVLAIDDKIVLTGLPHDGNKIRDIIQAAAK